jgi:hypothetical protein
MTSAEAWAESDLTTLAQEGFAEPDQADVEGVLTVGASAENRTNSGRLVLFGDADFLNNSNVIWGGNSLLASNSLNWLAADETAIALAPRETIQRSVTIPERHLRLLRAASILFGPVVMSLAGLLVWFKRRRPGQSGSGRAPKNFIR